MYSDESEKTVLNNIFTYHAPAGTQTERYTAIRDTAKQFANLIMDFCPTSREKDVAIERIRESVMWANASIAVNEVSVPDDEISTVSGM